MTTRWLTPKEQRAWRAYIAATFLVEDAIDRQLQQDAGMPHLYYSILANLSETPERRLRMADLADRVLLSRSGLTRLIDRLQAEGLVRREPSPDDARGTFTVLTGEGMSRLRAAAPVHLAGIRRHWLAHFDDDELREIGALLRRVADPDE